MNRIEDAFKKLKAKSRKGLITFVTAGDPDLTTTVKLVCEMEKQGADIIELGIPYSDPIAEGPTIQAANERALRHAIKIDDVMGAVVEMRKTVKAPLLFLLYYNCVLQYGPRRFFQACLDSGVDGLIIPDLPFEERAELDNLVSDFPVAVISMVAPTSKERIQNICAQAEGFLYCVSSLGVTGVRSDFKTDFKEFFSYINRYCHIPKALGFGISTPEQVADLKQYCDALIVGSAIVRRVGESKNPEEAARRVGEFTAELRSALDVSTVP